MCKWVNEEHTGREKRGGGGWGVVCVGLRQEETQREERALTIYKGQAANLNFVLLSHAVR